MRYWCWLLIIGQTRVTSWHSYHVLSTFLFPHPTKPPNPASSPHPLVFANAGPTVWNSFPVNLRQPKLSAVTFRRDLKPGYLASDACFTALLVHLWSPVARRTLHSKDWLLKLLILLSSTRSFTVSVPRPTLPIGTRNNIGLVSVCVRLSQVIKYSPDAVLVIVSNPCDILAWVTWKITGWPKHRIVSAGTILDTSRFRHLIAERFNVAPHSVHGLASRLGHGGRCLGPVVPTPVSDD